MTFLGKMNGGKFLSHCQVFAIFSKTMRQIYFVLGLNESLEIRELYFD